MKSITSLLIFILVSVNSYAQIVDIPDPNFKAALISEEVDLNDDGEIQVSEALTITDLSLDNSNINNLSGIESFLNLTRLYVPYNNITSLDISQNISLAELNIQDNQLQSLDIFHNTGLIYLFATNNNLTNIDLSQNTSLLQINLRDNQLTSVDVSQNLSLNELNVSNNNIQSIDLSSNIYLTGLVLDSCGLTSLDVSGSLELESLFVSYNQITNLDLSNNLNLSTLICRNNLLTNLDLSNNSELSNLWCNNNLLTNLNVAQNKDLTYLNCENNNLNTLIIKNGSFENLFLTGNSNLAYVCVDEEEAGTIANLVQPNVLVNSYCSFTPGGNYNIIEGYVLFDIDNDGCNVGDIPIANTRVEIDDGTNKGITYTNLQGKFSFYTGSGNFTVTIKPEVSSCHDDNNNQNYNTFFSDDDNNFYSEDFCITPFENCNDVEVTIVPLDESRPGFDSTYHIVYRNKGSEIASGDIEFLFDDTILDYVSSSATFDSQEFGSLIWNYTDLLPFETRTISVTLNLNSPMETPAVNIGDELDFEAIIEPIPGDFTPEDNIFALKQMVVGSFDPNDITCLEGDVVSPDKIGEYLHYNIRFENTGNAPATFVVVRDDIDETQYDLSTLQILNSSHDMYTRIKGNRVEFIFDDINLAPNVTGNVLFKIKSLDTLNVDDDVAQHAEIYFDFNFPIITNVAQTNFQALSIEEFSLSNEIKLYPNPTTKHINITSKDLIDSIKIYDIQGRVTFERSLNSTEASIDISDYKSGVYFIEVNSSLGNTKQRLIKN